MGSRIKDHALSLFFLTLFALALAGQAVAGYLRNNDELLDHGRLTIGFGDFLWSSDFAVVGTMVAFAIYLRQRGSAESKPVGTPHHQSALESA